MPVAKEDFACAACTKRHEVAAIASPLPSGRETPARLECRALPPTQAEGRVAVFPTVQPDHFCHVYFEADAVAAKARRESAAESAKLDAGVAETQARAQELPLGEAPADAPASRARRARSATQA